MAVDEQRETLDELHDVLLSAGKRARRARSRRALLEAVKLIQAARQRLFERIDSPAEKEALMPGWEQRGRLLAHFAKLLGS